MSSDNLWFINCHCRIRISKTSNADGMSVIDMRLPFGEAPPLHIHRDEDEVFHVIEGEVRFQVGDQTVTASTGDTLLGPAGVPHSFRVVSPDGARMLTVTRHGFEDMLRTVSRPAGGAGLPEAVAFGPALQAELRDACAANGIDFVGPPIA